MALNHTFPFNLNQILSESELIDIIKGKAQQFSYRIQECFDSHGLTQKESLVLFYVLRGFSAEQIGQKLHRSRRTIEDQLENLKTKLGVASKGELIERSLSENLLGIIPASLLR